MIWIWKRGGWIAHFLLCFGLCKDFVVGMKSALGGKGVSGGFILTWTKNSGTWAWACAFVGGPGGWGLCLSGKDSYGYCMLERADMN